MQSFGWQMHNLGMANTSEGQALESGSHVSSANERRSFPLSLVQQRLWVLDRLEPGNGVYNLAFAVRLNGPLHLDAVQSALNAVAGLHEILRAEFHVEHGEPVQVILPRHAVVATSVDLSGIPAATRDSRISQLLREEVSKPFDLSRGPLFRTQILRLSPSEHILLLIVHRIICDERSLQIFFAEIAACYSARLRGESWNPDEASRGYLEFARTQREELLNDELQSQLAYWKQQLAGAPSSVDLPVDHSRPPVQSFRGATCTTQISSTVYERLQDLSRSQHVTLFSALLAAFNILLWRYSAQDDLVLGTEVSGRSCPETLNAIGLFANQLVLRTDISGDPSVLELLHRVHAIVEAAQAHQDFPFEQLVDELNPERDLSRNPLFQIMFNVRNASPGSWEMPNLTVTPLQAEKANEKFDLTANLLQRSESLECSFNYNPDLFDAATISRMTEHYCKLLEEVSADPERHISELPLLGEAEQHKILLEFNETAVNYRRDLCIHDFLEAQATRTPEAIALTCEREHFTYAELNTRANRLAHYLRKRGVRPEVLVGICMERSPEMLVGILGILKAGGAYVPLDPAYPVQRLAAILEDAKTPVLVTQQRLVDLLPPGVATTVSVDADWQEIAQESGENPAAAAKPGNLAYVLFTSGSTGRPKGVAIEHRSAATFIQWAQSVFTPQEVAGTLFSTSMCFDLSVFEMFVPLSMGGRVIMAENALFLPKLPNPDEVTLINTVPSAIAELVRMKAVPASVEVVNLAGEALSTSLAQQIYDNTRVRKLYNLYGPTEDTTYSTYTLVPRGGEVTIGRPLANTQVYILDVNGRPTPIGVSGELHLAGEGLARGYFGRPDLTAERFVSNPFNANPQARMYRTGDLARFLPDGNIQYLGRMDSQVKIRGFRIEMGEIESVLAKHPALQTVVVVIREDKRADKRLVAYLVFVPGKDESSANLRVFLKENLPEYMIPSAFVKMDALPLTSNGKINRRALPAPDWSRIDSGASIAARDQLEVMLVETWQKGLGIPNISVTDNFFDLGGHSLLAARLLSEVEKITGRQIPLSALFRGPTVESLAQLIREGDEANPDPLVMQIQRGGDGLAFFAVASPGVETLGFGLLARHMGPDQTVYKLQGHAPVVVGRPFTEKDLRSLSREYIAAMRAVQPEGPYCLGGMCEGVQIAERMVGDLEAQGEEVGLFAIFDTWVLQHSQRLWLWRIEYFRQRLRQLKEMNFSQQWEACKRAVDTQWRRLTGKSRGRSEWYRAYWPDDFTPGRFRAPVILFKRPKQPFYYVDDPEMGWGQRSEGGVEIHEIEFDHDELLREPYVRPVGEQLAACVKRLGKRPGEFEFWPLEASVISSSSS